MHHVFVSYSRSDAGWVESVLARLYRGRIPLWIDRADIPMSAPWEAEIHDALDESRLFLSCYSQAWQTSDPCQNEADYATSRGIPGIQVEVGTDPDEAATAVADAFAATPVGWQEHTELEVRARDWKRSGRPRGALLASHHLDRLQGRSRPFVASELRAEFVRASARRNQQRRWLTTISVVLVAGVATTTKRLDDGFSRRRQLLLDQSTIYLDARHDIAVSEADVYTGLDLAQSRGTSESAANAAVLTHALATPVPDDAFRLPSAGLAFASSPVGAAVEVQAVDGQVWARGATEHDRRDAVPAPPSSRRKRAPSSWSVSTDGVSGVVTFSRDGVPRRTVVLDRTPGAVAISPDERDAAVALGDQVAIVDIDAGLVRLTLRGSPGDVSDVAWSSDGLRVWALSDHDVISWPRTGADVVVDEPSTSFRGLVVAAEPGQAWAPSSDGRLRRFDLASGEALETRQVADEPIVTVADDQGHSAVVIGANATWLVPLTQTAPPIELQLHDCDPLDAAWAPDGSRVYLACINGPVVELSRTGEEARRIPIPGSGARAVGVARDTGQLFVGSADGFVDAVAEDGEVTLLHDAACGGAVLHLEVADDGATVLPVGEGTGMLGCSVVLHDEGDGWQATNYTVDLGHANNARAAALSTSGSVFAVGYSDGTVILQPTTNIMPWVTLTNVHGRVWAMLHSTDDQVYLATNRGVIARFELCAHCVTNRALAEQAAQRAQRALELGLTTAG